jgi:hypothetical protein
MASFHIFHFVHFVHFIRRPLPATARIAPTRPFCRRFGAGLFAPWDPNLRTFRAEFGTVAQEGDKLILA